MSVVNGIFEVSNKQICELNCISVEGKFSYLTDQRQNEKCFSRIIFQPRQLNKTRVVIDEFDGTIVESEDIVDDFEIDDSVSNFISDQKIHSGT